MFLIQVKRSLKLHKLHQKSNCSYWPPPWTTACTRGFVSVKCSPPCSLAGAFCPSGPPTVLCQGGVNPHRNAPNFFCRYFHKTPSRSKWHLPRKYPPRESAIFSMWNHYIPILTSHQFITIYYNFWGRGSSQNITIVLGLQNKKKYQYYYKLTIWRDLEEEQNY